MRKIYPLFTLIVITFLFGCANQSVPVNKTSLVGQTITIIPTGKIKYDAASNRGGGSFGLLGALVESAVTGNANSSSAAILEKEVPSDLLFGLASKEVQEKLKIASGLQAITISVQAGDKNYGDLVKDESLSHIKNNLNIKTDYVLEILIPSIFITKEINGWYAAGGVRLRMIDVKNNKIIGNAYSSSIGMGGDGILINGDEGSANYPDAVKSAFERLIKKLVNQSMAKLFDAPK